MNVSLDLLTIVVRVGVTLLLAGALGLERELAAQAAGLRTHTLVALGACLFTLAGASLVGPDPTRVAAQVVSGVGFLGGGAIFKEGATVKGLTTAATLWVAAAIGLATALGAYGAAIATTLAALLITIGLHQVERDVFPNRRGHDVTLEVERRTLPDVLAEATAVLPHLKVMAVTTSTGAHQRVQLRAKPSVPGDLAKIANRLLDLDGVVGVEIRR